MNKHTPGPWYVPEDSLTVRVPGNPSAVICQTLTLPDAKLIAAAPDLLAALEAAEGIIDWALDNGAHPGVRAVHALILEAIRKAI